MSEIRADLACSLFNIIFELLSIEYAGVFGKQAEQKPHHVEFQRMAAVAGILHLVVQLAHLLGGFDVDRVLRLNFVSLITGDKTKKPRVFVQIFQIKFVLVVFFEIIKSKAGEIRDDNVFGQVALGYAGEIIQRLSVSLVKTLAARFVFDNQHALPEQINVAVFFAELFDRLFKTGHALAGNAEDVKKIIPEGFCLGVLGGLVLPFLGKCEGACFNFVPA